MVCISISRRTLRLDNQSYDLYTEYMGQCKCGHTRDAEKNCDGTHKVVKAIKEEIAQKIEALPLVEGTSQNNALGMRMLAAKVARE